jgi:hypothetical protein
MHVYYANYCIVNDLASDVYKIRQIEKPANRVFNAFEPRRTRRIVQAILRSHERIPLDRGENSRVDI